MVDARIIVVAVAAVIVIGGIFLLLNTHCLSFLGNHACVIGK